MREAGPGLLVTAPLAPDKINSLVVAIAAREALDLVAVPQDPALPAPRHMLPPISCNECALECTSTSSIVLP